MLNDQERTELHLALLEIQADDEREFAEQEAEHWATVGHTGWRNLLPRREARSTSPGGRPGRGWP